VALVADLELLESEKSVLLPRVWSLFFGRPSLNVVP
jgi:hypothetical protein